MSVSDEFRDLLVRVESGSQDAIWELVESLSPHIYRIVSKRMSGALRQRVGASDIVQATWASFLLRERSLDEFGDEDSLRAYISSMAMNKLRMTIRSNLGTQARDLRRESSNLGGLENGHAKAQSTVSEVFCFRESWNSFMESQPEHYRQIVQLRMEGLTHSEIADRLRLNERTVRRVLHKLVTTVAV